MKGGEESSHEISDDNPEKNEITITYANLVEKGLAGSSNQNKTSNTPSNKNSNPNPLNNQGDDKLRLILKSAKRRIGLKPMLPEHLSAKPILDDINDPKYSDIRKEAAKEFQDKEL